MTSFNNLITALDNISSEDLQIRLDSIVITHPDADHYGGINALLGSLLGSKEIKSGEKFTVFCPIITTSAARVFVTEEVTEEVERNNYRLYKRKENAECYCPHFWFQKEAPGLVYTGLEDVPQPSHVEIGKVQSLNDCKKNLKDSEKNVEDRKKSVEDCKKNLKDSEKNVEDRKKSVEDCKKNLKDCKKKLKDSEENVEDRKKKLENCKKNLKDYEKKLKDSEKNVEDRKKKLENCKKNLKDSEKNVEDCKKKLENCKKCNETSILTTVKSPQSTYKYDVVLTGDSNDRIILDTLELRGTVGVFQVPHHGSRENSSYDFYTQFHAYVYFISHGANYKHPHSEVITGILSAAVEKKRDCIIVVTATWFEESKINYFMRKSTRDWRKFVKIYYFKKNSSYITLDCSEHPCRPKGSWEYTENLEKV